MMPFHTCPLCGNEMIAKDVEKLLRGGNHTAVVVVKAEVCLRCGERLYSDDAIRQFEQIRMKLKQQDVTEFESVGVSFRVPTLSI